MQELVAVGLDGSENSWKALKEALRQAKMRNAALHVISINEDLHESYNATEVLAAERTNADHLSKIQEESAALAAESGVTVETVIKSGSSAHAIVDYVRKHRVSLLIIGDKGHSSFFGLGALLGTTADKITRDAPCSVLIVR